MTSTWTDASSQPLRSLARVFRSKNASPFLTTIDVFFDEAESYERVRDSGALTPAVIAQRLRIPVADVIGIFFLDVARGMKISVRKRDHVASGDPGIGDIFGAQQYIPLLDLPIPRKDR